MTAPAASEAAIIAVARRRNLWPAFALGILVVMLAAYPFWASAYQVGILRDALIFGILALSLDFLWGKAGVLSFGQAAFFGLGAYAVAILGPTIGNENAFLGSAFAGMALAAAVAGAVGYFLLYGGVRGPYLTIVTLALSIVAQRIATGWASVTGGDAGLLGAPPPGIALGPFAASLVDPVAQYALVVVILIAALAGVWLWCRGRRGRVLAAIQNNELKLQSLGYDTAGLLLAVFIASAVLAALAGGLYASVSGFVAPDLVGLFFSTQVIVWVAAGGRGTLLGPIIGTVVILRLQNEVSSYSYSLWPIVIGAFFIALVFLFPEGLLPFAVRMLGKLFPEPGGALMTAATLLQAENLSARFGGVMAVAGVSLALGGEGITCIVGPNGAGKSTLFNMLTGTVRPAAGRVLFAGHDMTGRRIETLARLGISRKFQTPSIFESLSVRHNIDIAQRGSTPEGTRARTAEILDLLGLNQQSETPAGALAHGQKQWLEIGMALATSPKLMLLDEPTAGMGPNETQRTAELVLDLARRIAIVVIEHDMAFVRRLACRTLVMHQGKIIADGAFAEIENDQFVRDVYLGRR